MTTPNGTTGQQEKFARLQEFLAEENLSLASVIHIPEQTIPQDVLIRSLLNRDPAILIMAMQMQTVIVPREQDE